MHMPSFPGVVSKCCVWIYNILLEIFGLHSSATFLGQSDPVDQLSSVLPGGKILIRDQRYHRREQISFIIFPITKISDRWLSDYSGLGDNLGDTEASELFIVRKFVQKVLWGWVQTSECLLSRYCRDSLTNRDGWQTDTGLFEMFVSPVWYSWDVSSAIWSQP